MVSLILHLMMTSIDDFPSLCVPQASIIHADKQTFTPSIPCYLSILHFAFPILHFAFFCILPFAFALATHETYRHWLHAALDGARP